MRLAPLARLLPALLALACAGVTSPPPADKPALGAWGVDLTSLDPNTRPGDDFFRFANGSWLRNSQIPPDRSRYGMFDRLDEQAEANVRALLEEAVKAPGDEGPTRKLADFYATFLDTAAIEAKGMGAVKPELDAIRALDSHQAVARMMARPDLPLRAPLAVSITVDQKDPDRYVLAVSQAGLGLPDRDYYLKDDARSKEVRARYLQHLEKLLGLAGEKDAAAQAQAVMALETQLAGLHWERAKSRERDLTYNLRSTPELLAFAPDFPWEAVLATQGVAGQKELVLRQLDAIPRLASAFKAAPLATWKSKLTVDLLTGLAPVLPRAVDEEVFDFRGRVLSGTPEQKARWKRAVAATNEALGEAVGERYVARHFPPASKAAVLKLVESIRAAYGTRIDGLTWMTPATKAVAREKLAAFRVKMGYPEKWRDYSKLEVVRGDAVGNHRRALAFAWAYRVERLGRPTDREEWGMTPQTVNAYYNATFNEIVFPAAILQPPFFDPSADRAVNYGGIGAVIGHEMGHGFDDQGAKSDAKGILRTWWGEQDVAAFKKLGDALAGQYGAYEPLPGAKLNGRLQLGENIGDNGGLQVAFAAYRASLGEQQPPVLDGFTGDQRFFLGYAQIWRQLIREAELRNRIVTDSHAPAEFRVKGAVRNMDAWYAAFAVEPGDKLYLPPAERVKIW